MCVLAADNIAMACGRRIVKCILRSRDSYTGGAINVRCMHTYTFHVYLVAADVVVFFQPDSELNVENRQKSTMRIYKYKKQIIYV